MVKEKLNEEVAKEIFSAGDVAEHLNISQTQYQRKEKGEVSITEQ